MDASVASTTEERREIELPGAEHVSPTHVKHSSKLGDALPGRVQEVAGQRVECYIDTPAPGLLLYALHKARVSEVEDAVCRDAQTLREMVSLVITFDCRKGLGSSHLGNLQGSQPDVAAGVMYEYRLIVEGVF